MREREREEMGETEAEDGVNGGRHRLRHETARRSVRNWRVGAAMAENLMQMGVRKSHEETEKKKGRHIHRLQERNTEQTNKPFHVILNHQLQ